MAGEPPRGGPGSPPKGGEQTPQKEAASSTWVQVARMARSVKPVQAQKVTAKEWPSRQVQEVQEKWMDEDDDNDSSSSSTIVLRAIWWRAASGEDGWAKVQADAKNETVKALKALGVTLRGISEPRGEAWKGQLTKLDLLVYVAANEEGKAKQAGAGGLFVEDRRRKREKQPPLWLRTWDVAAARGIGGPTATLTSNGRGLGLVQDGNLDSDDARHKAQEAGLLVGTGAGRKFDLHSVPRGITGEQVQGLLRNNGWKDATVIRVIPKKGRQLAVVQSAGQPPFGEGSWGISQKYSRKRGDCMD
eukprot:TRINITY_DN175_c0_g1_i16.p2 TRINITY_DN175_c0_g1~~TRINITY_DN175_c0_g1_i16.p2  ORF type:complete len:303 (+),score=87.03 TRINITY_DN175_c0_g1_i16:97-1005(+)